MKIAVAIATAGRRDILSQTIRYLGKQTRLPDGLYVCPANPEDLDEACLSEIKAPGFVVRGEKGSSSQRNAIINAAPDADIIVFFDDDFLPEPKFLEEVELLFQSEPDVVIATGHVLADGAHGPGLTYQDARAILDNLHPLPTDNILTQTYGGYGCNMAVRMSVARAQGIQFDEVLPLYGWWEDIDFSRRLQPFGRIVHDKRLRGVHMGTKRGRGSETRLGYSQVANILYLARKGSISPIVGVVQICKNFFANTVRCLKPEPWVDRQGRFRGNLMAFRDALFGQVNPRKILMM